jgi:hypothetical protein
MTVGAQQPQVLRPVIRFIAVDVIEFKRETCAAPVADAAVDAGLAKKSRTNESTAKTARVGSAPGHEHLVQRTSGDNGARCAATPALTAEMRCVESQSNDRRSNCLIVSSGRHQAEGT